MKAKLRLRNYLKFSLVKLLAAPRGAATDEILEVLANRTKSWRYSIRNFLFTLEIVFFGVLFLVLSSVGSLMDNRKNIWNRKDGYK